MKYNNSKAAETVLDLIDGYYPKLLEEKYKGGVLLAVIDKLSSNYEEK